MPFFSATKPTKPCASPPFKPLEPVLVSLEGNIGAGKSTLLKELQLLRPDWRFVPEPVDAWLSFKSETGESLLEAFYRCPNRWAYTFQNCALLTRCLAIEAAVGAARASGVSGRQLFITERSLDSDRHVFTKALEGNGSLDAMERDMQAQCFEAVRAVSTPLSAIVYLATGPSVCAQQIVARGREGEGSIGLPYLQNLGRLHQAWIKGTKAPDAVLEVQDSGDVDATLTFLEALLM
jgi:deoxyadenosine/deoxycytidine kinase